MASLKTDIWVYADWQGLGGPKLMGVLSAHLAKGRKAFSFEYDAKWMSAESRILLDPEIRWFSGQQFPIEKENFGLFLDSMPDRWGRTLMKRRAAFQARASGGVPAKLYDIDFLLGVFDESRMGALRFKLSPGGPFLDHDDQFPTPPWSSIRKLQQAAYMVESDPDAAKAQGWLNLLIAPGSSLGGARPKANVLDEKGQLWIAKFPSKNDTENKGAWEFLCYQLAINAGIEMAPSTIQKITGADHTFFTKRFDRQLKERIHFASAMAMTSNNEDTIKEHPASYLDLAEVIQFSGTNIERDLHQLWRRIIFNIAVSNTDDHLRNHGFLLTKKGWQLSPAYDINPSTEKNGLSLNIDMDDNALDFDLAKSVGDYFQLSNDQMENIIQEVLTAVKSWRMLAKKIGISRSEVEVMAGAFIERRSN